MTANMVTWRPVFDRLGDFGATHTSAGDADFEELVARVRRITGGTVDINVKAGAGPGRFGFLAARQWYLLAGSVVAVLLLGKPPQGAAAKARSLLPSVRLRALQAGRWQAVRACGTRQAGVEPDTCPVRVTRGDARDDGRCICQIRIVSPLLARRRPWQPPRYCQEDLILTVATVATIMYVGAVLLTVDSEPLRQTSLSQADTAASVVVVTGQGSADSVIAESLGGTVLHIPQSGVSRATRVELRRLDPTHVVVLGGMQAVSAATLADVEASTSASVTRVAGPDRYVTAARLATSTSRAPVRQVFVTTAAVPQQALEAASRASSGTPLLLVDRDSVPATTTAALRQLRPRSVAVLGDAAVVSDAVMRQLRGSVEGEVERYSSAG